MENPVEFYHSLLRFGVQPGLERIKALLSELGNPQNGLKTVHVAGTNGKGTTSTLIAEMLREAGFNTGLYTSPYIIDFRERIKFNSEMISEKELEAITDEVAAALSRVNSNGLFPTEFEAITAAAFLYYKRKHCDIAVLECGLGGRFDATNILPDTLCSVIVSVSFDHMALLGNTLAEIAWEKAGIIKSLCPVVISKNQKEEAAAVIKNEAEKLGSPLYTADERAMLGVVDESVKGSRVLYGKTEINIPFCGKHQLENASLALACVEILRKEGFGISTEAIKRGAECASLPARTEIISENPLIILDGSHNEGSTHALAAVLERFLPDKKILAVTGMMADKDITAALSGLAEHFSHVITVTPSNPRAMKASELAEIFNMLGTEAEAASTPFEGIEAALAELPGYDALVICGSLYLAADIRSFLYDKIHGE